MLQIMIHTIDPIYEGKQVCYRNMTFHLSEGKYDATVNNTVKILLLKVSRI